VPAAGAVVLLQIVTKAITTAAKIARGDWFSRVRFFIVWGLLYLRALSISIHNYGGKPADGGKCAKLKMLRAVKCRRNSR
jgi:hypothetical protein